MKRIDPNLVRFWFREENGALYWLTSPHRRIKAGAVAGYRKKYHVVTFEHEKYPRAHLVWALHHGKWPEGHVTHLNGDQLDDRIGNLADSVVVPHGLGALPYGVRRSGRKYMARLVHTDQHNYLGTFDTAEEAHEAFIDAHIKKHGVMSVYAFHICNDALGVVKCL